MKHETLIVGGGLAGLAAANYLARAGRPATVLERSEYTGGRARTQLLDGYSMNLGPHALFRSGVGIEVLRELGVAIDGAVPPAANAYVWVDGRLCTMPSGIVSLLGTSLFTAGEKVQMARLLMSLRTMDSAPLQTVTLDEWLQQTSASATVRKFVAMLMRVASYADEPAISSAGAALEQFQTAFRGGVLYLHQGWQSLVNQLRQRAIDAGARIVTSAPVSGLLYDSTVRGVVLTNGTELPASMVLLAGSPELAASLLGGPITAAPPIRAACLDVALTALPRPKALFALGLDEPLYASVHSAAARLAPEGGALIHLLQYGGLRNETAAEVRARLEGLLDALQPGWRNCVRHTRFLPDLVVSNSLVTASQGGLGGRPKVAVPGVTGLYLAGDWVGPQAMLADASLASARAASNAMLEASGERRKEELCLAQ